MATKIGTNQRNLLQGTPENDSIKGGGGNDILAGYDGDDIIEGGDAVDNIFGGRGVDTLFGGNGNDIIRGGDDKDFIYGDSGNDILRGGKGSNVLEGGDGNDILLGLGERKSLIAKLQDILSEQTSGDIPPSFNDPEVLTGGAGEDVFLLAPSSRNPGKAFERGQKYAQITDFNPSEGDVIRLPGSRFDYDTVNYGLDGTAILYLEDSTVNLNLGLDPISVSGSGLAFDVPNGSALVAILEDVSITQLGSDAFTYG